MELNQVVGIGVVISAFAIVVWIFWTGSHDSLVQIVTVVLFVIGSITVFDAEAGAGAAIAIFGCTALLGILWLHHGQPSEAQER